MNETNEIQEGAVELPLWRSLAKQMIEDGITYGQTWPVEFFESGLRVKRDANEFKFAMMSLRAYIETEEGVYIQSSENGAVWTVPAARSHEDVASRMDNKVRRYSVRSINIRSATLASEKAELTPEERRKMEVNLEHASMRLILMSRAKSFANLAKQHAPKLLEKKSTR